MKKMNYFVEFLRLWIAYSFAAIHVFMVLPMMQGKPPVFIWALDCMFPFMAFAGYFLMQGFRSSQATYKSSNMEAPKPASQAWNYLKKRLLFMGPVFLLAQLFGLVAIDIFKGVPITQWPLHLLNSVGELAGLQLTGIGLGNGFVGPWGTAPDALMQLNAPMWFVSGIFVCGYTIYYLLAKDEDKFIGWITPVFSILIWGSYWVMNVYPVPRLASVIGDFAVISGLLKMFSWMSLGAVLWVAVDYYKRKEFTKGTKVTLTVVQALLLVFFFYKLWIPVNVPFSLKVDWGSTFLITIPFTFLGLLNVDGTTRFFDKKIFKIPGRISMYIYMIHFPIMTLLSLYIENLYTLYAVLIVISTIVGYLLYLLNKNIIQPYFEKKPWYSKKQEPTAITAE